MANDQLFSSIFSMEEKQISSSVGQRLPAEPSGIGDIIYPFVNRLIRQAETIHCFSPSFSEANIFQILTKNIVHFLEADMASIWLFENSWHYLASFASQESLFNDYKRAALFDATIADEVVGNRRPLFIPDIWKEERWRNREPFRQFGVNSVLVVPVSSARFSDRDADPGSVLLVFYKEREKLFSSLEGAVAEFFSFWVSYILARKRIKDLQKYKSLKERIAEHIFKKLTGGEGIFMRDLFNCVIPELSGFIDIQRCALFSVNREKKEVVLEAGYPENAHGIGKARSTAEPYIAKIINPTGPFGQFEHERIDPRYILITAPQRSQLIPGDLRYFLETQNIHSVLYLPLKKGEEVNYFLSFDAQGEHKRFSEEEIEILLLFGMELMKGLKLEKLQDLLHDSKNIAISLAYYAKRIQNILEKEKYPEHEKLGKSVEIVLEGSNRLQEMFLILFAEGKEAIVDVTEMARKRFLLYQETMKEMKREKILFHQNGLATSLLIRCVPFHVERIIDNLLSNAVSAIPEEGGKLSMRIWQQDSWGVIEITNTAQVSREELNRHLRGEEEGKGKGRGLHICDQLIRNMGGEIEADAKEDLAIFQVKLPVLKS